MRKIQSIEDVKKNFARELGKQPDRDLIEYLGGAQFYNDALDDIERGVPEERAIGGLVKRYLPLKSLVESRVKESVNRKMHQQHPALQLKPSEDDGDDLPVRKEKAARKRKVSRESRDYRDYRAHLRAFANCWRISTQDIVVKAFREKFLPNGQIKLDEVERWIQERAREEENLPKNIYSIVLPPGHKMVRDAETGKLKIDPPLSPEEQSELKVHGGSYKLLRYHPTDPLKFVFVGLYGSLYRLYETANWLSSRCGWSQADAVIFILTGRCPILPLLSVSKNDIPASPPAPKYCITIEVDPHVGVEEVAAAYKKARQEVFQQEAELKRHTEEEISQEERKAEELKVRRKRVQRFNKKSFDLVRFVMAHPELETWEERWAEWRKAHPSSDWESLSSATMYKEYSRLRAQFGLPSVEEIKKYQKSSF